MEHSKQNKVFMSVPGGLAGQLFAVCYAVWIHDVRGLETHIKFFDVGTEISSFSVGPILDTKSAHSMGISYSQHKGNLNWIESKSNPLLRFARGRFGGTKAWQLAREGLTKVSRRVQRKPRLSPSKRKMGTILRETLLHVSPGDSLVGYPVDYRVIEEAWKNFQLLLDESGRPDFSCDTGEDHSVAVHWRLGDYFGNSTHGSISWESLEECIHNAIPRKVPIKIFTDSPDMALQLVGDSPLGANAEFVSSDIWSDLFLMSRSKFFIGSHSGISFLVALAQKADNPDSNTCLPARWFLDTSFDKDFLRSPKTFGKSFLYEVRFNEE